MTTNTITISGTLGADAQIIPTRNGDTFVKLRIAHSERRKNQQTGTWETAGTLWFEVLPPKWQNASASELRKGQFVIVTGRLSPNDYTDKDGNKQQGLKIYADSVALDLAAGSQRAQSNPGDVWAQATPAASSSDFDPWAQSTLRTQGTFDIAPPF